MWAGIGVALQIIAMVLKWWFSLDDDNKKKVEGIMKNEIPKAKDAQSIVRMFNAVNRV